MCVRWGGRCSLRCRCGRPLMQLSKEALWCQMWMSEVKALISLFFCRLISAITRLMSPQPSCVSQCRCRWFAAVHVITDAQTQHDSQSHRCSRLCCKVIWIIYYSRRVDAQGGCGVTEDSHWTGFRVVEEITGERGAHTGTAYCATTAVNKATTWC